MSEADNQQESQSDTLNRKEILNSRGEPSSQEHTDNQSNRRRFIRNIAASISGLVGLGIISTSNLSSVDPEEGIKKLKQREEYVDVLTEYGEIDNSVWRNVKMRSAQGLAKNDAVEMKKRDDSRISYKMESDSGTTYVEFGEKEPDLVIKREDGSGLDDLPETLHNNISKLPDFDSLAASAARPCCEENVHCGFCDEENGDENCKALGGLLGDLCGTYECGVWSCEENGIDVIGNLCDCCGKEGNGLCNAPDCSNLDVNMCDINWP